MSKFLNERISVNTNGWGTGGDSVDELLEQWSPILDSESSNYPKFDNDEVKLNTAKILHNRLREATIDSHFSEAPTFGQIFENWSKQGNIKISKGKSVESALNEMNSVGAGAIQNFDLPIGQILRRMMPKLIANALVGVQVIDRPTGDVYFQRAVYGPDGTLADTKEALFKEADTQFAGNMSGPAHAGSNPWAGSTYTTGELMPTDMGEEEAWALMSFNIDKKHVKTGTLNIRSNYTQEMRKDLMAQWGLNVVDVLTAQLAQHLLFETDRRLVRTIIKMAKPGAQDCVVPGTFDLNVDADGRWSLEKWKGLMFQIDREANQIAFETRAGRGNTILCSMNVASALRNAGLFSSGIILDRNIAMQSDFLTSPSVIGTMLGYTVVVDPFMEGEGVAVGYKGQQAWDNGLVFCPYDLMQFADPTRSYENLGHYGIGFKSRYALSSNPFVKDGANLNAYWRKFAVKNL